LAHDVHLPVSGRVRVVFDAIRELMAPPAKQKRRIGFGGE
jgi:hypothetical protein